MNPLTQQVASARIHQLQIEACRFHLRRLAKASRPRRRRT